MALEISIINSPTTHTPHPVTRIELALEEAKFHVDEFTSVEEQLQEALKKLRPIIPIKFEVKEVRHAKISPGGAQFRRILGNHRGNHDG